jgi:AraC-like DNA-binding protein
MIPIQEISTLNAGDCFKIFSREWKQLDQALHFHEVIELNLMVNAKGARRIIGANQEEVNDQELILIGSNLAHGWTNGKCKSKAIKEVVLQFSKDLFDDKFLNWNHLAVLKSLLEKSQKGILFSQETAAHIASRLTKLPELSGFASIIELMSILNDLSRAEGTKSLSNATPDIKGSNTEGNRIAKVLEYMHAHYSVPVTLLEVSQIAGMPETSFSRYFKHHTGSTFIDSLHEIRLGHVCRLLVDTAMAIADIAYKSGFSNMANFNRIFKSKKGCTPKEFRDANTGKSVLL